MFRPSLLITATITISWQYPIFPQRQSLSWQKYNDDSIGRLYPAMWKSTTLEASTVTSGLIIACHHQVPPPRVAWIVFFFAYIGQLSLSFQKREKSIKTHLQTERSIYEEPPQVIQNLFIPSQCVKQYTVKNLTVSNKKLFYFALSQTTFSGKLSASDYNSEASEISSDLCELLTLEKVKSTVWKHYGFPTENGEFTEKIERKGAKSSANYVLIRWIIKTVPPRVHNIYREEECRTLDKPVQTHWVK